MNAQSLAQPDVPAQTQKLDPTADQIDRAFRYHPVKGDQQIRYQSIREKARELAVLMHVSCPQSRERATAITNLETAVMWANAAIARNE